MWLVACNPGDGAALWAARKLRASGLEPLELISAEALAYALRFEHSLGTTSAAVKIELADGRCLDGSEVRGVLNRLTHVPIEHLASADEGDRAYAAQELAALFLSWLSALPGPVLNRPTPFGLPGPSLDPTQWLALAARADLPVPTFRFSSRRPEARPKLPDPDCRVVVACGSVHGDPVAEPLAAACLRLAELSEAEILGIGLKREPSGSLVFAGATPLPDLRVGEAALIDGLASRLRNGHS